MHKPSEQRRNIRRSILLGVIIGLGLGGIFAAGFFFRDVMDRVSPTLGISVTAEEDYRLLTEVQSLINRRYLRSQPDYTTREYAAIRGMLQTLNDPYTYFVDPPVAASESQTLAGTYGGIGVQLQRSATGELVLYPFAESPAANAGIENGDILRTVNSVAVDLTAPMESIDQMLRGEVRAGSGVEITVTKASDGSEQTVFIEFAVINVPSVVWRVLQENAAIGYVQILRFTARTPDELRQGMAELNEAGIRQLVLDMRNNGGGLLQESIAVADEFMDGGVIVYERDNQSERTYEATAGGAAVDLPMLVLVNHLTASGAELVAGALQDSQRAQLIGETTYGKGTVQQIIQLSDNSSLHVTAAEWLTPNRQPLNDHGLQPNIVIAPDPNGRDLDLESAVQIFASEAQPESSGI
ncbi:MAG: S41 family peptidase [Anaerolineae bacterium]